MALIVIPARLGAERLPGKPLLAASGRPLIVHTLERAATCRTASRVVVATDDEGIAAAVRAAGGEAVMTRADHASGTDRVAEAAAALPGEDLVVNVQGDEPEIEPGAVDALVDAMEADPETPVGTLAAPLADDAERDAPQVVKVVCDASGHALYFSRAALPYRRDPEGPARTLRHLGVYAYRRAFLARFAGLERTPLERTEMLEQLRVLEHGHRIRVVETARAFPGIDTREDYEAFVARIRAADAGTEGSRG